MAERFLSPLFTWRSAIASADGPTDYELDSHGAVKGSTQRAVALVLSLYMSEKGTSAFPAVATIAEGAGLSDRAVQRAIHALRLTGWLELVAGGGSSRGNRRKANEYRATFPQALTLTGEPDAPLEPRRVKPATLTGEPAAPDLVIDLKPEDLLGKPGDKFKGLGREPKLTDERHYVLERIVAASLATDEGSYGVLASYAKRLHITVLETIAESVERDPRHVGRVVRLFQAQLQSAAEREARQARGRERWLANLGMEYADDPAVFHEEIAAVGVTDPDAAERLRLECLTKAEAARQRLNEEDAAA